MTTHRAIVDGLYRAAANDEPVLLATVVRVTGSSYGGVGSRMLIRADGSTVGLVSGGCLESDLAEHARRVHQAGHAEVVRYDTRNDDDAPWGLGLGCNGVIDVLLEPLPPARGKYLAKLLDKALKADKPSVLATIITEKKTEGATSVGAHALIIGNTIEKTGGWGSELLAKATSDTEEVLNAGRRGLVRDFNGVEVAYEVVSPAIALVICGGGPDVQPIARIAADLGWNVTVVDHRQVTDGHATRYPGARVIQCADADKLAECVTLTTHTAGVVMSHNLSRDTAYVESFLKGGVAYIGVLGPRARTERMLADLAARGGGEIPNGDKIFAPVGMDLGSEGPDAIALAIIAEISAVMHKRQGGHLRDRKGPLHAQAQTN